MRIVKWILIVIVIFFVVAQAIRPAMTNPIVDQSRTIEAQTQMPSDVAAILGRSCGDCHTGATRWPWYSHISPVSWYLASDVNQGRRHLSLSDWSSYDSKRALNKLDEICEQVQQGEMPPSQYLLIHRDARLSEPDKKLLCDWTSAERKRQQQTPAAK